MPRAPVSAIPVGGYTGVEPESLTRPLAGGRDAKRRNSVNADEYTLDKGMEFQSRPCRDIFFAALYLVALAATVGVSSAALSQIRTGEGLSFAPIPKPAECPDTTTSRSLTGSLQAALAAGGTVESPEAGIQNFDDFLVEFWKVQWVLPVVVLGSCAVGVVWMQLLRIWAKPIVYLSLALFPLGSVAWGIAIVAVPESFFDNNLSASDRQLIMYICFAVAAFYCLLFFCCLRERIKLTIITLKTAGEALSANPSVFATCFCVFLVWAALTAIFVFGMVVALFNAEWEEIRDPDSDEVIECVYRLTSLGEAALGACLLNCMWTSLLFTELRGAVVAGSVGHWYYHHGDRSPPLRWPSLTSAKWAFTTQFGSLCFGSLILFILQLIQMLIRMLREQANRGDNSGLKLLCCMFECLFACFYEFVRIFTGFATIVVALSGQSFCDSAKTVYNVCKRNGFELVVVDQLASSVMGMGAFVFSLGFASLPWIALVEINPPENPDGTFFAYTGGMCGVAFVLAIVVLGSFTGVVINAASALFIAFVADRDAASQQGGSYGGAGSDLSQAPHVQIVHGAFLETHKPVFSLQEDNSRTEKDAVPPMWRS